MQKRIYIAGKVTGEDWAKCFEKFRNAHSHLTAQGFTVVNPMMLINDEACEWKEAMRKCIVDMLCCDAVYMLPCWTQSRGATLERFIAGSVGIEIIEAQKL